MQYAYNDIIIRGYLTYVKGLSHLLTNKHPIYNCTAYLKPVIYHSASAALNSRSFYCKLCYFLSIVAVCVCIYKTGPD